LEHAGGVGIGAVGDLPHQQFKGVTPFFGQAGIDGGQADIGETGGKDIVKTATEGLNIVKVIVIPKRLVNIVCK